MLTAARAFAADDLGLTGSLLDQQRLTGEEACSVIHRALHGLADAERDEAFALNLDSEGDATAMVEAHLTQVLDQSTTLRAALERVRRHASPYDMRVEQCKRMGFKALADAERLTTNLEEVLYGTDLNADSRLGWAAARERRSPGGASHPEASAVR